MAFRSSVHKSTSRAPISILFGREEALPLQVVISFSVIEDSTQPLYVTDLYIINRKKKLQENHENARKALKQSL